MDQCDPSGDTDVTFDKVWMFSKGSTVATKLESIRNVIKDEVGDRCTLVATKTDKDVRGMSAFVTIPDDKKKEIAGFCLFGSMVMTSIGDLGPWIILTSKDHFRFLNDQVALYGFPTVMTPANQNNIVIFLLPLAKFKLPQTLTKESISEMLENQAELAKASLSWVLLTPGGCIIV